MFKQADVDRKRNTQRQTKSDRHNIHKDRQTDELTGRKQDIHTNMPCLVLSGILWSCLVFGLFGLVLSCLVFGASGVASWGLLGPVGRVLGASWGLLGALAGFLGPLEVPRGGSWWILGDSGAPGPEVDAYLGPSRSAKGGPKGTQNESQNDPKAIIKLF